MQILYLLCGYIATATNGEEANRRPLAEGETLMIGTSLVTAKELVFYPKVGGLVLRSGRFYVWTV